MLLCYLKNSKFPWQRGFFNLDKNNMKMLTSIVKWRLLTLTYLRLLAMVRNALSTHLDRQIVNVVLQFVVRWQ